MQIKKAVGDMFLNAANFSSEENLRPYADILKPTSNRTFLSFPQYLQNSVVPPKPPTTSQLAALRPPATPQPPIRTALNQQQRIPVRNPGAYSPAAAYTYYSQTTPYTMPKR